MPRSGPDPRVEELASQVSALDHVEAVILGGSISTGMIDERSDCDLYVYTRQPIDLPLREAILKPRAAHLELQRDFWEREDVWIEHDGTKFEIMYRGCGQTEQDVERRLFRYEASVGYTTCVLHTLAHGHTLIDRNGWFKSLQQRVLRRGYPDELLRAVIAKNFPFLDRSFRLMRIRSSLPLLVEILSVSFIGPRLGWPATLTSSLLPTDSIIPAKSACSRKRRIYIPIPPIWLMI
jgi:Nucleotidyltransferase domain